ncbi:hypothetical protein DERP_002925 [Dermatophagoides pteronyssinus]|uniref:Uncharacterized protein n=1 Tax=Dermatophagoides pteronyssinus TaxID=6956 RepID=A0ABQ8JWH2_DERPT|nr:hypothetical protein DERP_002925 [Dermatophagoides pteronyssinus]
MAGFQDGPRHHFQCTSLDVDPHKFSFVYTDKINVYEINADKIQTQVNIIATRLPVTFIG